MRLRIAACVLLACLAGCTRNDTGDRQVVQLWAMGQEGEIVARMLPRFEQTHPHIQRGLQRAGFSGGWLDALPKDTAAKAQGKDD